MNQPRAKPRIVFLHYTAPPIIGGVEIVLERQLRLFADDGFATCVLAGRGGESGLPASTKVHIVPEIDSEHPGNMAVREALDRGELPPAFFALRETILGALQQVLRPEDVLIAHNVLNTHFNLPLTEAVHTLAARGQLPRLIVWCHDISRYVNPESDADQRIGDPWDLLRTFLPDAYYVTVSSRRQRLLAKTLGRSVDDIQVVANGVDPEDLLGLSEMGIHLAHEFGLFAADLVLLMPIRITRAKNIGFALEVAAALQQQALDLRLVVTGPLDPHVPDITEHFDELRAQRTSLGLEGRLFFVYEGTSQHPSPLLLDLAVVHDLYRICDVVLMPSHREGFGLPVLEAGMVDKPIFATDMPILEDLGRDVDYLIADGESPKSVASRIQEWAERDAAHRLRRRVRQQFSWPALFERHILPLVEEIARDEAPSK